MPKGWGSRDWSRAARRIRVPMGFLFAAFYLWRARPSAASIALSLLLVAPGLLLRAYASGYIEKNDVLTVSGPYAHTRNPLYLGSVMIALGFAAASRSLWVVILLALFFVVIYMPTILSEEDFLRSTFPQFNAYARRVPRLLPWPRAARKVDGAAGGFSPALYRKHREYNAVLGACAVYAALLVDLLLRR
jgi:protein-S-isoprenylcysteine O-methyltransferase Ste14